MADKNAIAVICKALRNMNPDSPYTLEKMEYIKSEYNEDPEGTKAKYPEVFYYFDGLVNCVVSQSQHPAGIVAAPMNLIDYCGMFLGSDGQQILPLDMDQCHALGLIKYDILGLKTIGVIDKTCKMIGQYFPKAHEMDFNDQDVYDDMNRNPLTVFQFESPYAQECFKKMNCHSIEDITLVNAALRPGGASYRDRLFNHEINDNGSEIINNLLKNSYGFLCLDEHQMIPTTQGIKFINEIKINDEVYTQNGVNKVVNVYDNGYQATYKLHTLRGDIIGTLNHQILTQDGWCTLETIMQNPDYYSIATRINDCGSDHYNLDELRLIGWLTGDGILHHDRLKNLVMFVNANYNIIQAFVQTVEKLYDELTCTVQNRGSRVNKLPLYYVIVVWKHRQMCDKPICDMLKYFGLYNKIAQEKEVPSQLFNADKESILTYLGAYTDTDCHLDYHTIMYHCASEKLILGIQELYRKLGYSSSYNRNTEKDFTLVINNVKSAFEMLKNYSISVAQLMQQDERTLKEARSCSYNSQINKEYVKNVITKGQTTFRTKDKSKFSIINAKYVSQDMINRIVFDTDMYDFTLPPLLAEPQLIWAPVKSITLYNEYSHVYDIEVENEHNFAVAGGLIVHNCYQEDISAFLQQICGFSGSDSDQIRRYISKKNLEKIEEALPKILEGYCSKSDKSREIAEQEARQFLKVIEDASSYMFNRNHALGYSLLTYLCGYYRHYYPVQYCTAYLSCAKNDDDLFNGQQLARDLGIKLQYVKFRFAQWDFSCDPEQRVIYKGMSEVPYMSQASCSALQSLYKNPYDTKSEMTLFDLGAPLKREPQFVELLKDMKDAGIDSRQIDSLIKLDYFSEFGDINYLLGIMVLYKKYKNRKKCFELIEQGLTSIPKDTTTLYDRIVYSFDLTGMISVTDMSLPNDYYFITEVKGSKYSCYQISTGKTATFRIRGKLTKQVPVDVKDVIKVLGTRREGKYYKNGADEWVQSDTMMEEVVTQFKVLKNF